jgi:hypothetical protein
LQTANFAANRSGYRLIGIEAALSRFSQPPSAKSQPPFARFDHENETADLARQLVAGAFIRRRVMLTLCQLWRSKSVAGEIRSLIPLQNVADVVRTSRRQIRSLLNSV